MTDNPRDPLASGAWADVGYVSAVPDFRKAPDSMFNAPYGWGTPDNQWQREHQGWRPQHSVPPVVGYPLHIIGWRFWIPKVELRRSEHWLRFQRASRYAFYASLSSLGFLALVAGFFGMIYWPAAIFIVFWAGQLALAGSIALWLVMTPMLGLLDLTYLWSLRRGKRGTALFWWTLVPIVALDILVTQALTVGFYTLTLENGEANIISGFTVAGTLASLLGTIPTLAAYVLNELGLQES